MSEFVASPITNNFVSSRLLSNITDSSIVLQLHDIQRNDGSPDSLSHFNYDSVSFYNDIVDNDKSSNLYNEDIINEYIKSGILSDTVITPIPPSISINGFLGSSHTIKNNKKIIQQNKEDHLEINYSLDANNNIALIVYRDFDGFSYSTDGGTSCVKIPITGLLYPIEVTSIGIQNFMFEPNIGGFKIWIGTLREGLKSYTLGETSWKSETSLEKSGTGLHDTFLFRHSLANINQIKNSDGFIYDFIPGNYAPIYILGIINNPTSSGLPIIVYVKNRKQTFTITEPGVIVPNEIIENPFFLHKYLASEAYKYVLDTNYNKYRNSLESLSLDWVSLTAPTTSEIFDVLKVIPINSSNDFTLTSSGVISAVSVYSETSNKYVIELLTFTATCHVNSQQRTIVSSKDLTIGSDIIIESNKFFGISTYKDNIFITELDKIWRLKDSWTLWLSASNQTETEKNTLISSDYTFNTITPISYISGFKGFGIIETDIPNTVLGIFNTDLGHITITLVANSQDFMIPITNSKKLARNLFAGACKDFQVIPEQNLCLSCGLEIEPKVSYNFSNSYASPIRYTRYSPVESSNLPSTVAGNLLVKGYKNYIHGDDNNSFIHNKYSIYEISTFNTDQLYFNLLDDIDIAMLKSLPGSIQYVDSRILYTVAYVIGASINSSVTISDNRMHNYILATTKYNRLKLLLRVTENINLNASTLETDLEIPFVPEIGYQIIYGNE